MKKIITLFTLMTSIMIFGCSNGQTADNTLPAVEFQNKVEESPSPQLIDVRTPEEFAEGHLPNAKNINWNGDNFEQEINTLDKNEPVFVYCRSGGRSSSAVSKMNKLGFKKIYELDGGISGWEAADLPVSK